MRVSGGSRWPNRTRRGKGFIERHWRKLLWGTDYVGVNDPLPQIQWIKALDVRPEVREAIAGGNARRVLGTEEDTMGRISS